MTAVSYTVLIDGLPVSPELMGALQQIEVEDHAELADMLRLRVATGVREDGSGWTHLDDDVFRRLGNIRVLVNIGNLPPEPLLDAYIVETRAEFSIDPGGSVLEVLAMDPTVLMNLEEKVRPWPNMSDSDIATLLFQEAGFEAKVDPTQPARSESDVTTIQRGTDMQFLKQLAERNGFEIFAEFNAQTNRIEGYYRKPKPEQKSQGVLNVNLGEATNVNTFKARFDMLKPTTVRAKGLDIETRSTQPAQSDKLALGEQGKASALAGDRPRVVLLSQSGFSQSGELQTLAQAMVDRSGWAISAEGDLHTVAYGGILRAKRTIEVRGAGREFSGVYYVEKVLHTLSGDSYTQRFTLRRNALGLTGQEKFVEDNALP